MWSRKKKEKQWAHRTIKTKIMCTIGPATQSKEAIIKLLAEGMDIARLNFSHGSLKFHKKVVDNFREACKETGKHCALVMDTHGPEIRTGVMKPECKNVVLKEGQEFTFYVNYLLGDQHKCCIKNYWELPKMVQPGDHLFVDYGKVSFTVKTVTRFSIITTVDNEAPMGDNKIVTIVGKRANFDKAFLSYQDTVDIDFAVRNKFDFIAISYVGKAEDVEDIRSLPGVKEAGIKLISKIESAAILNNLESIIDVSDAIYVARSELAVEVPYYLMPQKQREIAAKCNKVGKPAILATQVLGSMAYNPRPTRAECTDIANAILEGYDCVVLTDSTAGGNYAVESVIRLSLQAKEVEKEIKYRQLYSKIRGYTLGNPDISISESVASSAVKTAWDVDAALIIVLTADGYTQRYVAKYRPHTPILCVSSNPQTARQVLLARSCISMLVDHLDDKEEAMQQAIKFAKEKHLLSSGEFVVAIYGSGELGVANFHVIKVA